MFILWTTFICPFLVISANHLRGAPLRIAPEEDGNLKMHGGAPFKIALFADLHFGEDTWTAWGPRQDLNSARVMSSVLDQEQPGCEECGFRGTTRLELMKNEIERNSLSYSKKGPKNLWPSVSNYVLKLSSSDDSQKAMIFMYFFDSGGGSYPKVISDSQVKWFQRKSKEVNPHARMPEIIFWHIPSEAYKTVAPKFETTSKHYCVGSIFSEDVAAQEGEMGIMKVLEERPSVKAVFVGHNHGLDWCCPYTKKLLWLCFARHSGYGGYGNWDRGARIIEINERPFSLKSWITMEDGHLHSEVLLSS
ncbi:PREDICTED: probable inactive purple acid phosphatase 16 isoform X3 [Erythranthe guttata]|uniref:probable inactive purple acid phosphatase 16 isoform X3 n=1 Tax=Erythranthe guttata TaxID=4155 RepID=UPI00064DF02A|nr:PREDICTED: probable inactive purple acid phosphatase 16 isoform X3 [Erythranthe guttata]|eukprot:XP_012828034.1 PREDICTED: probable inactive purple acid phosphatase 16 isoform X3 [Erythranthe guttata]